MLVESKLFFDGISFAITQRLSEANVEPWGNSKFSGGVPLGSIFRYAIVNGVPRVVWFCAILLFSLISANKSRLAISEKVFNTIKVCILLASNFARSHGMTIGFKKIVLPEIGLPSTISLE